MEAGDVVRFWSLFEDRGFEVCIDGGWAVDAVLGRQTRPHRDLDIALPARHVEKLRALMTSFGFAPFPWPDAWEHNFVLRDGAGRMLDVHSFELHPDGRNRLGVSYCADHLSGEGVILNTKVRCVPPHWLVPSHTGYPLDADDWHDVRLLCERFDLPIPVEFARFRAREEDS